MGINKLEKLSEKYCLKWNDFNSHVRKAFTELRNDNHFCDVTLVSDDNHEFAAHKVVLSSCSDYFKSLLKNKTSVCIEGLSCQELKNVIDYIYTGEILIENYHIKRFLSNARRLKLAGLDKIDDNVIPPESCIEERKELSNNDTKGDLFSNAINDDDAGESAAFDFQSKIEVSNDQLSRVMHQKEV